MLRVSCFWAPCGIGSAVTPPPPPVITQAVSCGAEVTATAEAIEILHRQSPLGLQTQARDLDHRVRTCCKEYTRPGFGSKKFVEAPAESAQLLPNNEVHQHQTLDDVASYIQNCRLLQISTSVFRFVENLPGNAGSLDDSGLKPSGLREFGVGSVNLNLRLHIHNLHTKP